MKHKIIIAFFFFLSVLTATENNFFPTPTSQDHQIAFEEFRRGVQSYYRASYNEAILLFEKALSILPDEPVILEWLGKAYYSSGLEDACLQQWDVAIKANHGGILLKNKAEVVRERRIFSMDLMDNLKFSESVSFSSIYKDSRLFRQPLSAVAMEDGSFWATAYGTNEVLHFDANGKIIDRTKGPIEGFDRPFDIVRTKNGHILVSEFASDRISLLTKEGKFLRYFGKSGVNEGELLGPQFLTTDAYDNIYVSDFGNARISVFSFDGKPLFHFGEKNASFSGFIAPSGICVINGFVYVADSIKGAIYVFDTAGNYIDELLVENSFKSIESMREWNGNILLSSFSKAYLVDVKLAVIHELVSLGNAPTKITCATPDANGNILLMDFKNETVEVTSRISELAGGFFVTIKRVFSDNFPKIEMEVLVENRNREQIVGLERLNFNVTEGRNPVLEYSLDGSGFLKEGCDIAILLERSPKMEEEKIAVEKAIKEIALAMRGRGKIFIFSAGVTPNKEGDYYPEDIIDYIPRFKGGIAENWKFDLGLRLASSSLLNAQARRAVIFLSFNDLKKENFSTYGLNELSSYMANNNIRFYSLSLKDGSPCDELGYLIKKTGGEMSYIYVNEGLEPLISRIAKSQTGLYKLSYTSSMDSDFGRRFLPVEVEVRLLNRSGRDETSYYPPAE
ncbi:MAG: hypothetical protein ACTTJ3_04360 [Treponema sp.]